MSLIAHSFLPRRMFNMDLGLRPSHLGFGPSTLDIFDPFDDLDRHLARNFMWLNVPDFIKPTQPRVPKKHRITIDCHEYDPKSIKTQVNGNKLIISAREGENGKSDTDDYSIREFRKSFNIPENAETDKLVSFVTSNGRLVVEIPLKQQQQIEKKDKEHLDIEDLFPRITDGENGSKSVTMNVLLPKNIDPSKVNVTCKDHDLIIQAEETNTDEKNDTNSRVYFYRRTTLPENTDFNSLKCIYDETSNKLSLTAQLDVNFKDKSKMVPIEVKKKNDSDTN